jgi:hypothetical protein
MKVPQSIRACYEELLPSYQKLKDLVDARLRGLKSQKWHYESRVKELVSYAIKLETGREKFPRRPEDLFACTLVVENHSKITDATDLVTKQFKEEYRRPFNRKNTPLSSDSFAFDDQRLYVAWRDDPSQPPTGVEGLLFEVQIKTFLQHAWGIATHDLIYKTDEASWGSSRVAFQVKAMLENAEMSISEVKRLTSCELLDRCDRETTTLADMIKQVKGRWTEPGTLPVNIQGLAKNIMDLADRLRLNLEDVWPAVDEATADGRGAKLLNLSPYAAILEALIAARGGDLFRPLAHPKNRHFVFVPGEIDLPALPHGAERFITRP